MIPEITFAHFFARFTPDNGTLWEDRSGNARRDDVSRITVAYFIDDEDQLRYGAAFCSTKDNFSKKKGRELAERRARAETKVPAYTLNENERPTEVIARSLMSAFNTDNGPAVRGLPRTWQDVSIYTYPIRRDDTEDGVTDRGSLDPETVLAI